MNNLKKELQQSLPIKESTISNDRFIHSSLFSEVYIYNDLQIKFSSIWNQIDDKGTYDQFYYYLINLFSSIDSNEINNAAHSETISKLIIPMLDILGYGEVGNDKSIISNTGISLKSTNLDIFNIKPSFILCEGQAGKKYILNSNEDDAHKEIKNYLKLIINTGYFGSLFDRKSGKYDPKKDEIGTRGDVFSSLGPDEQMKEHLILTNSNWGIFTDGAIWRLYRKEASELEATKYFEFDLSELYNLYRTSESGAPDEDSAFYRVTKYLYWFFSKEALFGSSHAIPFVEQVYQGSQAYVEEIEDDLKERFVHAMTIACNGYQESIITNNNQPDIDLVAKTSESFIFNLIFIRACEARRVLPIHQDYLKVFEIPCREG